MPERKLVTESENQFDQLQRKLVPLWKSIEAFNQDPQTIVVVPSMSIDLAGAGAVVQAYEERYLFLLLLLRQPRARLIYVTSQTFFQTSSILSRSIAWRYPESCASRLFCLAP
jgi:hypothetical protein